MRKIVVLLLAIAIMLSFYALAHPGRTDSKGGHTNHSTGEYHYHHGYSAHQHVNGKCPYEIDTDLDEFTEQITASIIDKIFGDTAKKSSSKDEYSLAQFAETTTNSIKEAVNDYTASKRTLGEKINSLLDTLNPTKNYGMMLFLVIAVPAGLLFLVCAIYSKVKYHRNKGMRVMEKKRRK